MKIKSTTVNGSVFSADNPTIQLPAKVHMISICNNDGRVMSRFVSSGDSLYQLSVSVKEFEEDLSGDYVKLRIIRRYKLTEVYQSVDVATDMRGGDIIDAFS